MVALKYLDPVDDQYKLLPVGGMSQVSADSRYLLSGVRNLVRNGDMIIAQRGNGPWTASGNYTADGFTQSFVGGSVSTTRVAPTNSTPALLQTVVSGQSTAADYAQIHQHIETPVPLNGQVVTLTFKAKASSGAPKIGIRFTYAGHSDYASYQDIPLTTLTLSTTLQTYTVTTTLPANSTTIGASPHFRLSFILSSGSNFSVYSFHTGIQNNTFSLSEVQLEFGAAATPFERLPQQQQMAWNQRYYQRITGVPGLVIGSGQAISTSAAWISYLFPVVMRVAPTLGYSTLAHWGLAVGGPSGQACTALDLLSVGPIGATIRPTTAGGFSAGMAATFYEKAGLTTSYLEFTTDISI